ncbi:hypothetical protein AX14_011722 [Amanita brunnescens Koide BX004]|nr:hypothetical protein AX14_011722 [Amanita brunnescens Koide BX004]
MPLGEEPITSYFSRLPSGKSKLPESSAKHKLRKDAELQQPNSGPSRKRPRKATTSSLSSVSSTTPPPVWDLFSKTKSKKIRREQVINRTPSVISLDDDSDCDFSTAQRNVLFTKDTVTRELRNPKGSVQTKISSVKGKQRLHKDPPSRPITDQANTPARPEGRRGSFSSTFSSASAPLESMLDDDRDTEVLSSQISERQDELYLVPPTRSFQWSSKETARHSDTRFANSTPLSGSRSMDSDYLESYIVESSQTQNILLNYVSPRRPRTLRHSFVPRDEENTENIVQTSQTQGEIDVWARPDNTPRNLNDSASRPPGRTPSDVLFSVPRREASFTDTELAPQQHKDLKGLDENDALQEESVTESDSDGEVLGFGANMNFSHQEPLDVPSHSQYSDQTQSSYGVSGTFDGSIGSLPSVVKDFRDMFGSHGSYCE